MLLPEIHSKGRIQLSTAIIYNSLDKHILSGHQGHREQFALVTKEGSQKGEADL